MKKLISVLACTVLLAPSYADDRAGKYPIDPVPFTSVKVTDQFWGQRLKANREVTIPLAFSKCEETGRYDNFVKAAHPSGDYKVGGYSFDDTDVYKTIEGASYLLQTYPDKKLEAYIDSVLTIVAAAYSYKKLPAGAEPHRNVKLFWAVVLMLLPIALIFSENSMNNLQTVSIIAAFPIGIVILLILASFFKDARQYLKEKEGPAQKAEP